MAHRTCPCWQTHVLHGPNSHDSPSYLGEREPHYTYSPKQRLRCYSYSFIDEYQRFGWNWCLCLQVFSPLPAVFWHDDGGGRFLRIISNLYQKTLCPTPEKSMFHGHSNFNLSVCLWKLRFWQQWLQGVPCYGMRNYAVWEICNILHSHIWEYNDLHIYRIYSLYLTPSLLINITNFGVHVPTVMSAHLFHFNIYIWGLCNDTVSRLDHIRSNGMNEQETMWKKHLWSYPLICWK